MKRRIFLSESQLKKCVNEVNFNGKSYIDRIKSGNGLTEILINHLNEINRFITLINNIINDSNNQTQNVSNNQSGMPSLPMNENSNNTKQQNVNQAIDELINILTNVKVNPGNSDSLYPKFIELLRKTGIYDNIIRSENTYRDSNYYKLCQYMKDIKALYEDIYKEIKNASTMNEGIGSYVNNAFKNSSVVDFGKGLLNKNNVNNFAKINKYKEVSQKIREIWSGPLTNAWNYARIKSYNNLSIALNGLTSKNNELINILKGVNNSDED